MTDNPFAAPAAATGIQWPDLLGRLLVIEPLEVRQGIETSMGTSDAVRADIHVIDGDGAPIDHEDVLVFPMVLRSQLTPRIGQKVLGRLEQGTAKPGKNPPWRIAEATEADQAAGAAWLKAREAKTFSTPAAGAGAPPF